MEVWKICWFMQILKKNATTDDGNSWEDVIEKAVREPSLIISQI